MLGKGQKQRLAKKGDISMREKGDISMRDLTNYLAVRAAMPNSEEGSVVCCVPSCPDCHVKS